LIGSVGRLSPEKGFAGLIQAVACLQQQGLPVDLWIAGEGPDRPHLAQQIQSCPHENSMRLLGQVSDLRPFYQAMDLFVLNSRREGLPNVLLEAMAMETPAIATHVGGIADLIEPGKTGYLIEPDQEQGLIQSMRDAIGDPNRRAAMAAEARRRIVAQSSFDARMQRIAAIYWKILSRTGLSNGISPR
jgi:glycosyltransferase involved in cell wall biosynthesis